MLAWTAVPPGRAAEASPLETWVANLEAPSPPGEAALRRQLRAAETALARAGAPTSRCAEALGAARYATLHADLARARDALGERTGAEQAWRAVLDCTPRDAPARVELARLLLMAGRLDAAREALARATRIAPQLQAAEHVGTRLDYLAGRWSDAARRASAIAARHRREAERLADALDAEPDADAEAPGATPAPARASAAYWEILALLARRRGGLPSGGAGVDGGPEVDPELGDAWPAPLWRHLRDEIDEAALVAAMDGEDDAARRREIACEALYYTAQHAFARGQDATGGQRLARVVNLKVLYFVEHELALAELASRRKP
jgi:tetratricopeptide (TPR) repeat protein